MTCQFYPPKNAGKPALVTPCAWVLLLVVIPFSRADETLPSKKDRPDTIKLIAQQIKQLNHPSYRVRQVAKYAVERHPLEAIEVIGKEIDNVDAVVGVQLVDMVGGLALHSDLLINSQANDLLRKVANDATSVGRAARNSLSSIADLQEEKAVRILRAHGAYIGPQSFSINGKEQDASSLRLSLVIADNFTGGDFELQWIRFLKNVQVVYLRGRKITDTALEATSELKHLRGLKLRSCTVTREQLARFSDLDSLEQFGLSYVDVDDSIIPIIERLPIGECIRLYGTKITEAGRDRLARSFEGVEVFRGSGGFLGISSSVNSTVVSRVTPNSAAALGGIQVRDRIIAIDEVSVTSFDDVRHELGKHVAGDSVQITVQRLRIHPDDGDVLTLKVTLQEES